LKKHRGAGLGDAREARWWLGFGPAAGIALISKFLIFFYLAGLAVGVLATPLRRSLSKPWLYIGASSR
jgi:4-amino-4-deoxy-L-arabinose transferase-like glycosyltransferase